MELFKIFGIIELKDGGAVQKINQVGDAAAKADKKIQSKTSSLKGMASGLGLASLSLAGLTMIMTNFAKAAEDAERSWNKVRQIVDNVGMAWDEVGPKIEKAAKAYLQLGMDDETAAESIGHFINVTHDLNQALDLTRLAADVAAYKQIDLASATSMLTKVLAGGNRALKDFGINAQAGIAPGDALAMVYDKVRGSAEKMATATAQNREMIANLKEDIGGKVLPAYRTILEGINKLFTDPLDGVKLFIENIWAFYKMVMAKMVFGLKGFALEVSKVFAAADYELKKNIPVLGDLAKKNLDRINNEIAKNKMAIQNAELEYINLEARRREKLKAPQPPPDFKGVKPFGQPDPIDDGGKDAVKEKIAVNESAIESLIAYEEAAYAAGKITAEQLLDFYDTLVEKYGDTYDISAELLQQTYQRIGEIQDIQAEDQKKLDDEEKKRLKELADEEIRIATETAESIKKYNEEVQESWVQFIDGIRQGTVTGESIWDSFLSRLYQNFIRFLIQSAMAGKASGIMNIIGSVLGIGSPGVGGNAPAGASIVGGKVTFHDGGTIGADSGRWLPGMRSDERMIRAQVGETVTPKGGQSVSVDVNVINNGQPVTVTKKQTSMDGPRTVVDLWIDGYNQNIGGIQKIAGGR